MKFEVAVSLNHDVMTCFDSTSVPGPLNLSLVLWLKLFKAATKDVKGQHTNVLKHCVYVLYGCRKQFEVAVSLNHDVMTSF